MTSIVIFFSFRYSRRDVLPLGKFTLNISGCPTVASYTQRFYQIIQQLVPSVSSRFKTSLIAPVSLFHPNHMGTFPFAVILFGHEPPEHEPDAIDSEEGLCGQPAGQWGPAAGQEHFALLG